MVNVSDIHRQISEAWNRRDWETFRSLLDSNYTYTGPDGKEQLGPDAGVNIGKMYANAFPDGKMEVKNTLVSGNTAVTEFIARGTHKGDLMGIAPTGKHVELRICNVMEVRDGKAYREREYFDVMSMMVQLGVAKPPGKTSAA